MLAVRTVWTGFTGGPGYTNLYFDGGDDPDDCMDAVEDFFQSAGVVVAGQITMNVEGSGFLVDEATGIASGTWASTGGDRPVTGGGSGAYMGPAGVCVTWRTASLINGRIVKGRTFLVPAASSICEADGSISNSLRTTVLTAAAALATNSTVTFGVWHRPSLSPAGPGSFEPVINASVSDQIAVLRSRRS